jgi:hypothetical protein
VLSPPLPGAVLYNRTFEDDVLDSGGWGHQDWHTICGYDPCYTNSNTIRRGELTLSGGADTGSYAVETTLPAESTARSTGAQMIRSRHPDIGTHDWYAVAMKFDSNFQIVTEQPANLFSVNYQDPNGTGIDASTVNGKTSVYVLAIGGHRLSPEYYSGTPVGGGYAPRPAGVWPGVLYLVEPGTLQTGVWYEFILHLYNTIDTDGVVEGWARIKGQTTWTRKFSVSGGFPTFRWDDSGGWSRSSILTNTPTTSDKFGFYAGSASFTRSVWHDNFTRASSFGAAAAAFSG